MKKSDLQSGMVVSLRDWKEKFILIDDVFCSYERKDFLKIGNYDENLNFKGNDRLDIIEVYKCKYPNLLKCFAEDKLELIWERGKVEKELTFEEVDNEASKFCESNLSDRCRSKGCGECIAEFIYDNYNVTRK